MSEIQVTDAMREAGEKMADDCFNVSLLFINDESLEEFLDNNIANKDVVRLYGEKKIKTVEAVYIAMERAKAV